MAIGMGMFVVDVSVTHPVGVSTKATAATTDGAAAARRGGETRRICNRLEPDGYLSCPFL
jgi:hypothetical protein